MYGALGINTHIQGEPIGGKMGMHLVDIGRVKALYNPAPNSELATAVSELESVRSQLQENQDTAAQLETTVDALRIDLASCKKWDFEKWSELEARLTRVRLALVGLDRELGRLKMRERTLNQKCLQETRLLRKMR